MMWASTAAWRLRGRILGLIARHCSADPRTGIRFSKMRNLEKIGSSEGGWIVPAYLLGPGAICYCVGVGEDITFDLGLLERFSCHVYGIDPTPRAKLHVQRHASSVEGFHFIDLGLWDADEVMKFYAPASAREVSHSILNLWNTSRFFEAKCRRLSTIMRENGHPRLSLLKIDIEGAEYRVVDSIVQDRLDIDILCVEYDELHDRLDDHYLARIKNSLNSLFDFGYSLVSADRDNYTLVKTSLIC